MSIQPETQTPPGGSLTRLVRALGRIEKQWPKGYWLFATGSGLHLMKSRDGQHAMLPNGGVDPSCEVACFKIPNDGGDW